MAFQKKEWKNRLSEFPNRRRLEPTGIENTYDVVRAEGNISETGDAFAEDSMNDLEERIARGIADSSITTLLCTKSSTVYALTGLAATEGKVPILFAADAAYAAGDTVTIDGTAYELKTRDGSALTTGAWMAGAIVTGVADVDNKTLTVAPSVPVALPSPASLTVTNGPGNTPATYDGSAAKTVQVPYFTVHSSAPSSTPGIGELYGVY